MNCTCGEKLLRFEAESNPDGICFFCRMKIITAKNRFEDTYENVTRDGT